MSLAFWPCCWNAWCFCWWLLAVRETCSWSRILAKSKAARRPLRVAWGQPQRQIVSHEVVRFQLNFQGRSTKAFKWHVKAQAYFDCWPCFKAPETCWRQSDRIPAKGSGWKWNENGRFGCVFSAHWEQWFQNQLEPFMMTLKPQWFLIILGL